MGLFNVFKHPKSGGFVGKVRGNLRPSIVTRTQGEAISFGKGKGHTVTPNRVRDPSKGKYRKA
ncbi:hypothetical protein FAI41_03300 [Acetobacteraceae bacterium]|nr:hypothetical protein FAI41_03300 [Acetobacteraceae bacterium]